MGRSLLIMVSGLVIITGIVRTTMYDRLKILPERTTEYYSEQQARNISNGLINQGVEQLKINNEWAGSITEADSFYSATLHSYTKDSKVYPPDHGVGTWDNFNVLLYSEAEFNGYKVATEVLMGRRPFSRYAYFSRREMAIAGEEELLGFPKNGNHLTVDPNLGRVWFTENDVVNGPVHTNGTFYMRNTPTFNGFISSPNAFEVHEPDSATPAFNGGFNFDAEVREMPDSYNFDLLRGSAHQSELRYENRIELELYVTTINGQEKQFANIREKIGNNWTEWHTRDLSGTTGVISTSKRIDIKKSEIKGAITIHSETMIEIDGDIRYRTDPRVDPASTDMLGLVSEDTVRISRNAHKADGTKDLDVHASILALNSSFYVHRVRGNGSNGEDRGELRLLGGIIQEVRGIVGTRCSGRRCGFTKSYTYDTRLLTQTPPFFPREEDYVILYWKDKPAEKIQWE